jgi:hypothetical protein
MTKGVYVMLENPQVGEELKEYTKAKYGKIKGALAREVENAIAEYLMTRTRTRTQNERKTSDCSPRKRELELLLDQIDPSWRDDGGDRRKQICLNDIQKAIYYQHGYKDPRTARSYARALQMAGYVSHHVGEVYNVNHR